MGLKLPALPRLEAELREDLEAVESLLRSSVASDLPLLDEASRFLIEAGGKRFRPLLVLLSGRFGKQDAPESLRACAAAIELTHLATLYHDDVMDETMTRRGVDTAHRRYGNATAILVGDFLFARASKLSAPLGVYVSERLASTIGDLVTGQVMETELSSGGDQRVPTVEEHLEVLRLKTAVLIETSCHLGAYLSGADHGTVQALTRFGAQIGLAFQLSDDLLDLVGDESETGKRPGTDLREGVLTLAPLLTLSSDSESAKRLRSALQEADLDTAIELLRQDGSIDLAREKVRAHRDMALQALEQLPRSDAADALRWMAETLDDRTL
ncbi:MAG: polyprenyl synthetase family protein [Actinomycetota bacterium]